MMLGYEGQVVGHLSISVTSRGVNPSGSRIPLRVTFFFSADSVIQALPGVKGLHN